MIRAILTDIEGTTSSLSFVKDVLFPHARAHIADWVRGHAHEAEVAAQLEAIREKLGRKVSVDEVGAQLVAWIDADAKITELKVLQGLVWEEGYRNGDFEGHVHPDAKEALERWHERGIRLYVYSSGSVHAQKLLFGHTRWGDLNPLFDGHFDTRIGAKVDSDSYRRIASEIGLDPGEVLFLSDSEKELDAARAAGMQTCWLVREGAPATAAHRQVPDFAAIEI